MKIGSEHGFHSTESGNDLAAAQPTVKPSATGPAASPSAGAPTGTGAGTRAGSRARTGAAALGLVAAPPAETLVRPVGGRGMLEGVSSRTVSPIFVGRQYELARLRSAFVRTVAGEPQTVLVGGEAGIGKSRLVEEFAARLDATVATGACIEMGSGDGVPFGPFAAALRSLDSRGLIDRESWEARELARILPELGEAPQRRQDEDYLRIRLFEAVQAALLKACADRPLVLVVEDLHWADRASRELFGYLARVSRGGSVLTVGTYRADELHRGHPLRSFLAELERVRGVERLELERFSRAQTALQLQGILGREPEAREVDEVFCRAEGNAFFNEEVACGVATAGAGPELSWSLRDLLMARVERLPELTQRLLRLLASAVQPAHPPLIAAVAGLSEDELTEALRPAFAANVLVAGERETYKFRHALMREVVFGELLPGEHTRIYLRLAEELDEHPELVSADCFDVELAHYWYRAHVPDKALQAALFAAEAARRQYAFSDELAMFERALELWDQVPHEPGAQPDDVYLMFRASIAAGRASELERGLAFADAGLAAVDQAERPALTAHLLDQRGKHLRTLGRGSGIDDQLRAVELLREDEYKVKRGYILSGLANTLSLHGRLSEALVAADEALELCAEAGDPCDVLDARTIRASILTNGGRIEEGLAIQRATLVTAEELGQSPTLIGKIYICLSSELYDVGRYGEAAEIARRGLESMLPCNPIQSGMLRNNLAEPLIALGAWDEAARNIDEAIDLSLPGVHDLGLLRIRADLHILRGEYEQAQADLDTARRRGGSKTGEPQYVIPLHRAVAGLAAARGQIAEVRKALDAVLAGGVGVREGDERFLWEMLALVARAEADHANSGNWPASESSLPRVSETATLLPVNTPVQGIHARLVEAESVRAKADGEQEPEVWRTLASDADDVVAPIHLRAYLRYRLAEANAVRGERPQAAQAARRARELIDHLGARPLLEQIDALARAARLALQSVPAPSGGTAAFDSGQSGPGGYGPGAAGSGAAGSESAGTRAGGTPAEEEGGQDGSGLGAIGNLGLTRRELDVLRLLTEGLSNGQIGSRLFISTKTVSVHVSNILAKLGVSSRTEAAAVAHRLRVFDIVA